MLSNKLGQVYLIGDGHSLESRRVQGCYFEKGNRKRKNVFLFQFRLTLSQFRYDSIFFYGKQHYEFLNKLP